MHFDIEIRANIESKMGCGKAIILIGSRQVGKTTLIKEILKRKDFLFLNGDDPTVRQILNSPIPKSYEILLEKGSMFLLMRLSELKILG